MHEMESLTRTIIGTAISVHKNLGPGLFESVYETILAIELEGRGLMVSRQEPIPFVYKGQRIEEAFRIDLVVNRKVFLELKSLEKLSPVHFKQLLTYLRLANVKLGLLMNFGGEMMKDNIFRIANNL